MSRLGGLVRIALVAALLAGLAGVAHAFPVMAPFGSFPKAIVFTGAAVPANARAIGVADGNDASGPFESTLPGLTMNPLGDGSWACTGLIYPGSTLQYYFEIRIPEFDEGIDSWFTQEPGGARNHDANRVRTVTIPDTAIGGYVVYNAYGDQSVWGRQGASDTDLSLTNPYLANWRGGDFLTAAEDQDTSGRGGSNGTNSYNLSASQVSATGAEVRWEYSMGGDGLAYSVEGDSRFNGVPALYGFRIMRADSDPARSLTQLAFTDATPGVTGNPAWVWSDNDNDPWGGLTTFTDTGLLTAAADSVFVFTVLFRNAYGMGSDSANQNFAGGWAEVRWSDLVVDVDGAVDLLYGPPIGEDTTVDHADVPNLDLSRLWATRDLAYFYFAVEVDYDLSVSPWGNYGIFIDTTNDSNGASSFRNAGRGKNAVFSNRKPEYAVYVYNAGSSNEAPAADGAVLYRWNGGTSSWDDMGPIDQIGYRYDSSTGRTVLELATDVASLGSPSRTWIEAFSTGNSNGDTIIDTINKLEGEGSNDEWNGRWDTTAASALSVSTPFPPAPPPPMGVTATVFDTTVVLRWAQPPVNAALVAEIRVYLDTDPGRVARTETAALRDTLAAGEAVSVITGLQGGATYSISLVTVGTSGETAASPLLTVVPETDATFARVSTVDSSGRTTIEVPDAAFAETFSVRILNFNDMYDSAQYDTVEAQFFDKMLTAMVAVARDPTVSIISENIYSDTLSPVRQVVVFRANGTIAPAGFFSRPCTFSIGYQTEPSNGAYVLGTPHREENLIVRKLDEGEERWVVPSGSDSQWVDAAADSVFVLTSDFSIWTILAAAGPVLDFSRIAVYPNPFNAQDYLEAGGVAPPRVTFAFIPASTDRIEIFNVAGERVRTLNRDDGREFESQAAGLVAYWDAKNDYGRDVASGVYLFWVRGAGRTHVGKVAIIK